MVLTGSPPYLLLVESNPFDVDLVVHHLRRRGFSAPIVVVHDGEEALEYLHYEGRYERREHSNPAVIVLGLSLPKLNGMEVLQRMQSERQLKDIPVLVFTSSASEGDLNQALALGAQAIIEKPTEYEDFKNAIGLITAFWDKNSSGASTKSYLHLQTSILKKAPEP